MSSISLYSPTSVEPVPEDAPKDPATIYGQTKLAGEHLLRWYADNHGIDSRGIRPTWESRQRCTGRRLRRWGFLSLR